MAAAEAVIACKMDVVDDSEAARLVKPKPPRLRAVISAGAQLTHAAKRGKGQLAWVDDEK